MNGKSATKATKRIICALLCAALLSVGLSFNGFAFGFPGLELSGKSSSSTASSNNKSTVSSNAKAQAAAGTGGVTDSTATDPNLQVVYTPVELEDSTKNFFASIDGDITLTVISAQKDLVNGTYIEYYNSLFSRTRSYYYDLLNTLKAMTELNDYVKLDFVDPFSTESHSFISSNQKYDLEYGDLFISCYSNFDGNPSTRYAVIPIEELFKLGATKNDKKQIIGVRAEKTVVEKLYNLRTSRDINIAYLTDLCLTENLDYLNDYLDGWRYNIDYVNLKSEKLGGYDMILIAAPIRDVTLEEIVLLDSFLENSTTSKTLLYFCPKTYVALPNLNAFLQKWGLSLSEDSQLYTNDDNGYFAHNTQVYGESAETWYTKSADSSGGAYIMNNCTPITLRVAVGTTVTPLLWTRSSRVSTLTREEMQPMDGEANRDFLANRTFPLITLSEKTNKKVSSKVITCASVDFITSYFARQNDRNEDEYSGNLNGNLNFIYNILESVGAKNRTQSSGLADYAISQSDHGIDTTSGLATDYIMAVAVSLVSAAAFVMIILLSLKGRKKNAGKYAESHTGAE